jgi:hypothetical protein
MPRRLFHQFVNIVCGMVPRPALHTVSPLTEAFLRCDAVKAAQLAALGPFREQYAQRVAFPDIPQIIVVEGMRPSMQAFLCLGNVVAINSRYWDDIEDSCDVIRMCNLIMRVKQHGLQWDCSQDDYPVGATDQHPAECVAGREKIAVQQARGASRARTVGRAPIEMVGPPQSGGDSRALQQAVRRPQGDRAVTATQPRLHYQTRRQCEVCHAAVCSSRGCDDVRVC